MDRLRGIVRDYDWGDVFALPELLGHPPSGRPEAEYWLGAHPSGPAVLETVGQPLDRAIAADPAGMLGPAVVDRYGQLPFLVKLLAARQALSIQAHPSSAQAEAGFAREQLDGPPVDAPGRIYRDRNHKPELVCALTPFEARCGFRDPAETAEIIESFGSVLRPVRDRLVASGPAETALWLLALAPGDAGPLAVATVDAARSRLDRCQSGAAAAEMTSTIEVGRAFPGDVGVVVALLLNHVVLEPGQALFLGAGNVHAYLRGVAIEVMANSDNVIRGGLTGKHVDVGELAAIVDPGWGPVPIQTPTSACHTFDVPVDDFDLTRIDSSSGPVGGIDIDPSGPEIVLVTAGSLTIGTRAGSLVLEAGQAAFVEPGIGPGRLDPTGEGPTVAWRVTVG